MSVLIIGAGGQLGSALAESAAKQDLEVDGLVRRPAPRIESFGKVHVGDARRAGLGLAEDEAAELAGKVESIVVTVGSFDLSISLARAQAEHVVPLRGVLDFAKGCGKLRNVVLVSSLLALGDVDQRLRSDFMPPGMRHRNFYEWAKLHGEKLAQASGLPVDIVRAGHIVGTGDAPPQALFELLRMLAAGWPLPVVGSNRYWACPPDFATDVIMDKVRHGTGGSSIWAVDPASPTYAEIFDLINARFGVRTKRVRSAKLARALGAVVKPSWLDLPMSREVFDYCTARWDLELRCLTALLDTGRVTAPSDRGYLVRALDHEFARLRELLP
ncbi:Nucleoside-diphosphate-sugar epimerase [Amycolatopsis xylanica]|uniref:Nucleoside-diphosphate-sugar epimerase n=1 Tax=Amycolatopsis xylanica TaxID=589385 RepID=A0A1H3PIC3_9PSEU|nr:SDR family oxidoreductase [Amycolatopsis xylanica]SDZ00139.1 Nucleoside-diphosphate-sugar epimerase [Amycolatopsis xylanica]